MESRKGGGDGFKDTTSSEDSDDAYIFDEEHFPTCNGDVSDDKMKEILEVMLNKEEMKKLFMIVANQKYGVPIKSTCIIMNNNYIQNGKTITKDPDAEKDEFYMSIDEKLDVIIYVVDLIWHELNDNKNGDLKIKQELNESIERLHKMMMKLEEKVDHALDKILTGDCKNDSEK